jgi:hypothetical protein
MRRKYSSLALTSFRALATYINGVLAARSPIANTDQGDTFSSSPQGTSTVFGVPAEPT